MSDGSAPTLLQRRGWLAAILALLVPGLGHLYLGRRNLAMALSFMPSLIILSGVFLLFGLFAGTVAVAVAVVLYYVGVTAHAWLAARRGVDRSDAPRWYEYIGYIAAVVVLASAVREVATDPTRGTPTGLRYRPYKVASHSMLPTLVPGDYFAVKIGSVEPSRGRMIAYHRRDDPNTVYIHRVVALAGDTVELIGGELKVNDVAVPRRRLCPLVELSDGIETGELIEEGGSSAARVVLSLSSGDMGQDLPAMVVPEGEVVVLGDYRANSADSRIVGTVTAANIVGEPLYIFWSRDISRITMSLTTTTASDEKQMCASKFSLFD